MRVVLVLGAEALTTKQIHERLPDVAQASLYRAVARLVNAGIITVVERNRRGGAMERVYRVAVTPEAATASTTPEEFVAATETLARSLSLDAARHAATGEWSPARPDCFARTCTSRASNSNCSGGNSSSLSAASGVGGRLKTIRPSFP